MGIIRVSSQILESRPINTRILSFATAVPAIKPKEPFRRRITIETSLTLRKRLQAAHIIRMAAEYSKGRDFVSATKY